MNSLHMSPITVTDRDNYGAKITCIYAISEDTLRDTQIWEREGKPGGYTMREWLEHKGCQLNSFGSNPAYIRCYDDGTRIEEYYCEGKPHREGGPAFIGRYPNGTIWEQYFKHGALHREDGPAEIRRFGDGSTAEAYFLDGVRYRKNEYDAKAKPLTTTIESKATTIEQVSHITVTYSENGEETAIIYAVGASILCELDQHIRRPAGTELKAWLESKGCQFDSPNGPTRVIHYADGTIHEDYYRNGKLYRENGPACIQRKTDGSTAERYYLGGDALSEDEYYAKANPLLTGMRLPLANGGQEALEGLLREAIAEQTGRPDGREYISPPLCP